ncbi:MAG TPA: septal ring lytic transglycosylase RlpA family protein [Bordetella sp.]
MRIARTGSLLAALLAVLVMAGCSTTGGNKSGEGGQRYGGGYYKDDGPGSNTPSDAALDAIPDAVPRIEPLASGPNQPYVVFGERYVPDTAEKPFREQGLASWYGRKFHGARTSNGERYDMYAMTAAHPTLPIPSYARITSKVNGRSVIVRVNDRGPFHSNRIMDLSYTAAFKLGLIGPGSGEVVVERILPSEIRTMMAQGHIAPEDSQLTADEAFRPVSMPLPQAPAPEPLPPAANAAPASAGAYYLQLGAFSKEANAQTLVSRINEQLGNMPQHAVAAQIAQLYRVRIGPYDTREAALGDAPTVNAKTGILPSLIAP